MSVSARVTFATGNRILLLWKRFEPVSFRSILVVSGRSVRSAAASHGGHGMMGDARQPNSPEVNSDDILNGPEIAKTVGRNRLVELMMPCCDHCNENVPGDGQKPP